MTEVCEDKESVATLRVFYPCKKGQSNENYKDFTLNSGMLFVGVSIRRGLVIHCSCLLLVCPLIGIMLFYKIMIMCKIPIVLAPDFY